jgi:transcriptional regulator
MESRERRSGESANAAAGGRRDKSVEREPPSLTTRQKIITLLTGDAQTALGLSQTLKIREKEVYDHLSHIRRSLVAQQKRLRIEPAQCLECGYVFQDRSRLTKPGKCPRCRGTHIQDPRYRVA